MFKENVNLIGADIGFAPPIDNFDDARGKIFLNLEAEAQTLKKCKTDCRDKFGRIVKDFKERRDCIKDCKKTYKNDEGVNIPEPQTFEDAENVVTPKDSTELKADQVWAPDEKKDEGKSPVSIVSPTENTGVSYGISALIIFVAVAVTAVAVYYAVKTKKVVKPF
jgi:hypothetical protein